MARLLQRQRRYRRLFLACLILAGGLGGALCWQLQKASRLQAELDESRATASETRRAANLGNRSREQAEELASFILDDLRYELVALGRTDILGESARRSLDYFENLPPELKGTASTDALATIHNTLANVRYAEGKFDESVAEWQASLTALEKLRKAEPDNFLHLLHLAETRNELAIILREAGRVEDAMVANKAALDLLDLPGSDPQDEMYRINRAATYFGLAENQRFLDNFAEAIPYYEQCHGVFADDVPEDTVALQTRMSAYNNAGFCHMCLGDDVAAEEAYRAALVPNRRLIELEPENRHWQKEIATLLNNLGTIFDEREEPEKAFEFLDEALALRKGLVAWDPVNTRWQLDYANSLHNHASLHLDLGEVDKAMPFIRDDFDVYQLLISREPDNENWHQELRDSLEHFNGRLVEEFDRNDLANRLSVEVAASFEELARDGIASPAWNLFLSSIYGELSRHPGSEGQAIESRLQAVILQARNLTEEPENPERVYDLAAHYIDLGEDLVAAGRKEDAARCFELSGYLFSEKVPPGLFRRGVLLDLLQRHLAELRETGGDILVASDAVWKYEDSRSFPGDNWTQPEFDDTGWKSGPAILGYGNSNEATLLEFGGDSWRKNITAWFRHSVEVAEPGGAGPIRFSLLCDDAAVVYLNGQEIIRHGLPGGEVSPTTRSSIVKDGFEEGVFRLFLFERVEIPLKKGRNVFAVEVHQNEPQSSDLALAMEVQANAPLIEFAAPADVEALVNLLDEALPPVVRDWLATPRG